MANSEQSGNRRRQAAAHAWSVDIARVAGIPVRLHLTFLLLLVWLTVVAFQTEGAGRWNGLFFVVGVFGCVALHELGHSLVARRFGIQTLDIVLYPIGGVARLDRSPLAREELWVALAGPTVNLLLTMVLGLVLLLKGGATVPLSLSGNGALLPSLMVANLILAVFNLVPAFPMDGGRVLRAILAMRMDDVRATEIAAGIGQTLAFAFGFWSLLNGNVMLLFVAFFIYIGAGQEAAAYRSQKEISGVKVRQVMVTDFRTLKVGDTLREAADVLLETSQQDFPVEHFGELRGILYRRDLLRGLSTAGPDGYVAGAMSREPVVVGPDDDVTMVLYSLQPSAQSTAIVMEADHVLGLVTIENVAEFAAVNRLIRREPRQ